MTPMLLAQWLPVVALLGFAWFAYARLKSYLLVFQQEEYDGARSLNWIARTRSVDRTMSAVIVAAFVVSLVIPSAMVPLLSIVLLLGFVVVAQRDAAHLKTAKKPLVMTSRASRIFWIAYAILIVLAAVLVWFVCSPLVWLVPVQACPLALVCANLLLSPFEAREKARYWKEAHDKLLTLKPFIVGITGSFGKTSVKQILGHVLQHHAPTLATPGSVNTPMGISRIVREQLRPSHKFFLAEMGAYGPGSIKALCELAPPKLGILTAVGAAHLERFGSREITARAKMELGDAALANGGSMIVNASLLPLPPVAEKIAAHRDAFVTVGAESGATIVFSGVTQTRSGLEFAIAADGKTHAVKVPLFGRHQALNVALAFAAAQKLGMAAEDIVTALRTTPQTKHRLEVRPLDKGALLIDDAYNSNPDGFASALELLAALKTPGAKTYLVTPGMVELGKDHDAEHLRLGTLAAAAADTIFVVAPARIPTFIQGIKQAGTSAQVIEAATFLEAQSQLFAKLGPNDVVLYENDLPDLYERRMRL